MKEKTSRQRQRLPILNNRYCPRCLIFPTSLIKARTTRACRNHKTLVHESVLLGSLSPSTFKKNTCRQTRRDQPNQHVKSSSWDRPSPTKRMGRRPQDWAGGLRGRDSHEREEQLELTGLHWKGREEHLVVWDRGGKARNSMMKAGRSMGLGDNTEETPAFP